MAEDPAWSSRAALAGLAEAMDEGVLVFDERLICRVAGRRLGELFGVQPVTLLHLARGEVLGRLASAAGLPDAHLGGAGEPASDASTAVAADVQVEVPSRRTLVWTSAPIVSHGTFAGRLDLIRDVTGMRSAERASEDLARKLEEITTQDALTGLPNRKRFESEIDREHRRAQRGWEPYAIACIDVDGMQAINDAQGREAGDALLRQIGEELRASRREYDLVARWKGDAFVLLLPGAGPRAAKSVVKRAVRSFRDRMQAEAGGVHVSVSAGAAVWEPPSQESAEEVVARALAALAVAKARGPATVEVDAGGSAWKDDAAEG